MLMKLNVKVIPNSKSFRIQLDGETLKIWVRNPAEGGRANQELLTELSRIFGSVKILKGHTSRRKLINLNIKNLNELSSRIKLIKERGS